MQCNFSYWVFVRELMKCFYSTRIPDLVKDPEAEAAFEALRGLVEASLQQEYEAQQAQKKELENEMKAKQKKYTAKKSTTSLAKAMKRATARKSTTNLSEKGQFSYYGIPEDPLNFNDISTRMSIGGMEITLNASKLAGMFNLKPSVRVRDCEQN